MKYLNSENNSSIIGIGNMNRSKSYTSTSIIKSPNNISTNSKNYFEKLYNDANVAKINMIKKNKDYFTVTN